MGLVFGLLIEISITKKTKRTNKWITWLKKIELIAVSKGYSKTKMKLYWHLWAQLQIKTTTLLLQITRCEGLI